MSTNKCGIEYPDILLFIVFISCLSPTAKEDARWADNNKNMNTLRIKNNN